LLHTLAKKERLATLAIQIDSAPKVHPTMITLSSQSATTGMHSGVLALPQVCIKVHI
jgi:hypothetical protein